LTIDTFKYLALIAGLLALLRPLPARFSIKSLLAVIFAIFMAHLFLISRHPLFGFDFGIFWEAGRDVRWGIDPYSPARFGEHPFLNPPTSLPLFALFASLPLRTSLGLWTVLNVLMTLGLVLLASYALVAQSQIDSGGHHSEPELRKLDPLQMAALAVCLVFSDSSLMGLYLGQFNVFVAVMILAALAAQGRGHPVLAGICLSLATVKFVTMIPFLILFRCRADRLTWVVLMASVLGLCALTGRISDLPGRVATLAQRAEELAAPGMVNDYSYDGTRNEGIISFEHLFYRLGMRDREWIRYTQFLALAAVGAWVAYLVILKDLPRPAAASLVSFFSLLFLYHRDYDTVILALPWPIVPGKCE
jgi:Glycosyltransferase family 87